MKQMKEKKKRKKSRANMFEQSGPSGYTMTVDVWNRRVDQKLPVSIRCLPPAKSHTTSIAGRAV